MSTSLTEKVEKEFKKIPNYIKTGVKSSFIYPKYFAKEWYTPKEEKAETAIAIGTCALGEPLVYYLGLNIASKNYLMNNPEIGAAVYTIPFILRVGQFAYYGLKEKDTNKKLK